MANTLTTVIPQLLAQGLDALREMAIMPKVVNLGFSSTAGQKGSSIDVPIPSAITAVAVTPGATPPATADITTSSVSIALDQWFEAPFHLSDSEMLQIQEGTIPNQAQEAVRALANNIDSAILGKYTSVYGAAGAAGTTPFGTDLAEAREARKLLFNQLAPAGNRRVVLNGDAEENALGLRAIQDASWRASADGIQEGNIGRALGADWWADQNVPLHTAGGATGYLVDDAAHAAGVKTVAVDTGSNDAVVGDIFTVAGDTQQYVVTGITGSTPMTAIQYEPANAAGFADDAAITFVTSHRVNLMFHRDAFALAMRPFAGADPLGLGNFSSITDPVSGLSLRLEATREHKRTRFSYDVLYGVQAVRPALAARIMGEAT